MHRPAVPEQAVKLYRSADQVPGKYEEVALLHSQGPSNMTNEPQMLESMQKKAAELGAIDPRLEDEPILRKRKPAKSRQSSVAENCYGTV